MKTYRELITLPTFQERYDYLKLSGGVGVETFGYDRYLNQALYRSREWKRTRDQVIIRDNGCDLAIPGYSIYGMIIIHHINPLTIEQIEERDPDIFNLDYLITTSIDTHNAIHYGGDRDFGGPVERVPNDTCPWK